MSQKLVECVPNFSEGRSQQVFAYDILLICQASLNND